MSENFLSLEWFKSTTEKAIEKAVLKKLKKVIKEEKQEEVLEKPYITVKLVNDVLIVVFPDGNVLTKSNASEKDFYLALNSKSEKELRIILASEKVIAELEAKKKEEARLKTIQKGIKTLAELDDFVVENNTVYLSGTSRSMPQLLVEKFIEIVETQKYYTGFGNLQEDLNNNDEYLAHKNFFMWCCLNPRAEVADELYRFLTENSFRITKQGFFVALRNVVTLHGSPELVHFISNTYNKVKAVWKKNPNEYTVFLDKGEYKLIHDSKLFKEEVIKTTTCPNCDGNGYNDWNDDDEWEDCETCNGTGEVEEYEYTTKVPVNHGEKIGNLVELYLDLPNREENRFTDDWTKTFDIRVGQVTSMPMEECNWSTQDCAAAGLKYVASL